MKVAIVTLYWNTPEGGGIKAYLTGLVETLKKISKNIEIEIIYKYGDDVNNYQLSGGEISLILGSISALKKIQPAVINVNENWVLLFGSALYCKFHKNVRLIHSFHSELEVPTSFKQRIRIAIRRFLVQWAINQCDYVTSNTTKFERIAKYWGIKLKTKKVIIYAGVKPREVTEEDKIKFRKRYGIRNDSLILLVQAFTATEKKAEGVKLLMRSFKKLKDKYPNLILILTREGEYSNELKGFAKRKGIHENVIFTGDVENPFIPLEVCDIFVLPWQGEMGMGIALLEAMSVGKPIITTSLDGTLEPIINGKNGLSVKFDEDELEKGIIKLIEDRRLAAEIGANARKTALEKFTWERSVKKYLEIYGT